MEKHGGGTGKRRVLVVDDEAGATELVACYLEPRGFEVVQLNDPTRALEALRPGGWDLLIVDYMMPRLRGVDLVEQVRREPGLAGLKVMLLSAKDLSLEDRERCLRMGVSAQRKPFTSAGLFDKVASLLGSR